MAVGLGVLGLAPADFWSMTPPELAAALDGRARALGRGGARAIPPLREELAAMMRRFPD